MTTRPRSFYADRADHYFEDYLRRQAYIEKVEDEVAKAFPRNEGAASYALKNDVKYWQYREACTLRDRDMAIVTMSALMAQLAGTGPTESGIREEREI